MATTQQPIPQVVIHLTLDTEAIREIVTLFGLSNRVEVLNAKIHQLIKSTQEIKQMAQIQQSDIDNLTSVVNGIKGSLDNIDSTEQTIQQEVAALQVANPTLDLTALTEAANALGTSRDTLQGHVDALQGSLAPVMNPQPAQGASAVSQPTDATPQPVNLRNE